MEKKEHFRVVRRTRTRGRTTLWWRVSTFTPSILGQSTSLWNITNIVLWDDVTKIREEVTIGSIFH